VRRFREVMSDPASYPVLLHCLAGIHRTGIFTAIYRMEFEHWSNADAMAEMRACGYVELDEHVDVLGYLESYRPSWKQPDEQPQTETLPQPAPLSKRSTKKAIPDGPCGPHRGRPLSAAPVLSMPSRLWEVRAGPELPASGKTGCLRSASRAGVRQSPRRG
jgi:hypothetical protein